MVVLVEKKKASQDRLEIFKMLRDSQKVHTDRAALKKERLMKVNQKELDKQRRIDRYLVSIGDMTKTQYERKYKVSYYQKEYKNAGTVI